MKAVINKQREKKMKLIRNIFISALFGVLLIGGITTETQAWPKVPMHAGVVKINKPGPQYVWVNGHYKRNAFGKLVWVPGHWKKV